MVSRLSALLLVLVLVCAGLMGRGFVDPAAAPATPVSELAAAVAIDAPAPELPADPYAPDPAGQTLAEGVVDLPALIMAAAPTPDAGLTLAAPRALGARTLLAPYLDGPQRPPRAALVA